MIGITGLLKIGFPTHTVLLNDGGITTYNGDTYTPNDSLVGSLASIEELTEGVGNEIPALQLTFAPPNPVAISTFTLGAIQKSPVTLYVAEFDSETGAVIGTPDLMFIGFVDQPQVSVAFRTFSIKVSAVPYIEWLFQRPDGNELSSAFHKSIFPGETGHDNATGLGVPVAWGTESPDSRGVTTGGGSKSFGGFLGALQER